jgi:signal transduction histidine kinase
MRSLYLRIWLTVVAALALFALVSGWALQRHLAQERTRIEAAAQSRIEAWADLLQRSLPAADAPGAEQAAALRDWSQRLRVPLALDDAAGERVAASDSFLRREADVPPSLRRAVSVQLADGRTLWVMRPPLLRRGIGSRMAAPGGAPPGPPGGAGPDGPDGPVAAGGPGGRVVPGGVAPVLDRFALPGLPGWPEGTGLVLLLALLFLAVAGGAYPVVRRLTRRLEALKAGVEDFGAGVLNRRVDDGGRDEVAAVAVSFNRAAERIEALVRSNQSLLANASHELRSPLARLKMALAMLDEAGEAQRPALKREIEANIAELDALVEEVLLASRLDAAAARAEALEPVALLPLAAEEAARVGAEATGEALQVKGDERLLRRALRNLLENARRYGGGADRVEVGLRAGRALLRVCDRGAGVPESARERIFEPFYRLPGHAEREGGVGLGLSLVRQIAWRHRGLARCEPREGGGSCFVLDLPAA